MDLILIIEIITAALALIGLYCLAKYVSDTFFLPREIVTAVTVTDAPSRENADVLLGILKNGMWRMGKRRLYVVVSERYRDDTELIDMIRSVGAEYCFTSDM